MQWLKRNLARAFGQRVELWDNGCTMVGYIFMGTLYVTEFKDG